MSGYWQEEVPIEVSHTEHKDYEKNLMEWSLTNDMLESFAIPREIVIKF